MTTRSMSFPLHSSTSFQAPVVSRIWMSATSATHSMHSNCSPPRESKLINCIRLRLNSVFPGTNLLNCAFLAADIKACQAKGKIVTISLGGANGGGAATAAFADQIWNLFLGGSSSTRPFGDAVLDG